MQNLLPFETRENQGFSGHQKSKGFSGEIERKVLVRKEAQTDEEYGCKPEDRKTEEIIDYGIVNIDKPKGPTSHQVSDYVQKILGITKAGHSGTLE